MTWYDFELVESYRTHGLVIAGGCTALACVLSALLIIQHWCHYRNRTRQRYIVRIIMMVPIYALDSFLSMNFIEHSTYFDTPRDCYEAYVIFNFVALMIDYMGGDALAHEFFEGQPPAPHTWPLRCLDPHEPQTFLRTVKICTLQYTVVKPMMAILSLYHHLSGSEPEPGVGGDSFLWMVVINNISVSVALYYLLTFYRAAYPSPLFRAAKPFSKFLCVKAVVFFSFWQYTALLLFAKLGLLRKTATYNREEVEVGLDDFLICVEMAIAAIAHHVVFPYTEHTATSSGEQDTMGYDGPSEDSPLLEGDTTTPPDRDPSERELGVSRAFEDTFSLRDVVEELHTTKVHLNHIRVKQTQSLSRGLLRGQERPQGRDSDIEAGIEMM